MKNLGVLHHFLGMHVQPSGDGLVLSQKQYMVELLDRTGMSDCKPCLTPVDINPKVASADGELVTDASDFRSLAGAQQQESPAFEGSEDLLRGLHGGAGKRDRILTQPGLAMHKFRQLDGFS